MLSINAYPSGLPGGYHRIAFKTYKVNLVDFMLVSLAADIRYSLSKMFDNLHNKKVAVFIISSSDVISLLMVTVANIIFQAD